MKIALTVLHGNITDSNSKYIGNKEALSIAKIFAKYYDIDVLTCEYCNNCIHIDEDFDINKYDKLLVVNGSLNMFGGLEIKNATTIYKLLHKFNNQIYYILTDTNMPFMDYYNHIKGKDFSKQYDENSFKLKEDLIILSQFSNFDYIRNLHKNISIKDIIFVPWALWKLELPLDDFTASQILLRTTDLIYGGSFRSGKRLQKMLDYFFNKNIVVELFGNLEKSNFKDSLVQKYPIFSGKVPANMVISKNSEALATIVIGDQNYNNNTVTLRVYESLLSDAIVFIDNDFDTEHKILNDDFLYVNSGKELEEKILLLKSDNSLRNKYLQNQKQLAEDLRSKQILSNQIKDLIKE